MPVLVKQLSNVSKIILLHEINYFCYMAVFNFVSRTNFWTCMWCHGGLLVQFYFWHDVNTDFKLFCFPLFLILEELMLPYTGHPWKFWPNMMSLVMSLLYFTSVSWLPLQWIFSVITSCLVYNTCFTIKLYLNQWWQLLQWLIFWRDCTMFILHWCRLGVFKDNVHLVSQFVLW
jgi:hypothetical protein